MPRTTNAQVRKLIDDVFIPCDFDFSPFVETANILVTAVCVNTKSNYSNTVLEIIERWLSGHFAFIRLGQIQSETIGRAITGYATKIGFNLAQTKYGQQAMTLDYLGNLAKVNAQTNPDRIRKYGVWWGAFQAQYDQAFDQVCLQAPLPEFQS